MNPTVFISKAEFSAECRRDVEVLGKAGQPPYVKDLGGLKSAEAVFGGPNGNEQIAALVGQNDPNALVVIRVSFDQARAKHPIKKRLEALRFFARLVVAGFHGWRLVNALSRGNRKPEVAP